MGTWLRDKLRGDWQIWFAVAMLSIFSILVVYSATSALAFKQAGGNTETYLIRHASLVFLGLLIIWFVHKLNYSVYAQISRILLWITPLLLIYTLFKGREVGGAKRWVDLGVISFQASDLVRLVLITNLAAMLARRQNVEYKPATLVNLIFWCALLCGLLAASTFSTAVIMAITCFIIMWVGRVPTKYLLRMVFFTVIFIFVMVAGSYVLQSNGVDIGRGKVVVDRTEVFLNKDLDRNGIIGSGRDDKYQREQAMIAIARGGLIGIGPGNSFQRNYLPEAFSDYIYAIIIEEYGFAGALFVMGLYLWILYRGLKNVADTQQAFGGLLCVGLTFSIVFQAFVHMFINVGLGPVTGQTLPLVSMGGTSIVFSSIAIGIVLSVTRDEYDQKVLTN